MRVNRAQRTGAVAAAALILVFIVVAGWILIDKEAEPTSANPQADRLLVPGGQSIGVKMDVKGVLVVGLEEIETAEGRRINPGLLAGLQLGDSILAVDGNPVSSAEEVATLVNGTRSTVDLTVRRKGETLEIPVVPVLSASEQLYKIGVWVRDKTAGLGTLTFFDPSERLFGALGHAITDPITGQLLNVEEGVLLNASVESVMQGKAGEPGEIRGIFYEAEEPLGELTLNTVFGIFGTTYLPLENSVYGESIPVASPREVKKGAATILTTLEENTLQEFEIEIEKVNRQSKADTKGLVIRITDEELIAQTGGIIQGMSGSPILQNGKLVGAVTHVFVNDPCRGYGVFIEWMLAEADE